MVTACNYPVTDGIEVFTQTARVRRNRTMIIEWLLARCGNVPILNALATEYGIDEPRFGRGDDTCILCGMCVRVCSDVVGAHVLGFFNRGTTRYVGTPYNETSEACIACGACAQVCPTGCITIDDEAAQIRQELPLGPMTAIYIPTMQAVPHKPVIDAESCIHFKTDGCRVCAAVCEAKAIDHGQQDRHDEIQVGSIIVSTGFQSVDAKKVPAVRLRPVPQRVHGASDRAHGERLGTNQRPSRDAGRRDTEGRRHHPLRRITRQGYP